MMLQRDAIERLTREHNESHNASDTRVIRVAPGYGRNTDGHYDDSNLIVTVAYTARVPFTPDPFACDDCDAIYNEIIANVDDTGDGYDGPMNCGKHIHTYPNARAVYGYLDGEFILWMN